MKPGLYIHIPFCEQRCYYCAFTVRVASERAYEPYIDCLVREIALCGFDEDVETIYLGGGTPSIIGPELLERIFLALPSGASEITIEANPGTLDDAKLRRYRDLGINRISLGVQSFHDADLRNAGRLHRNTHIFSDFEALRKHGFGNINFDLIGGLPGQQRNAWSENLDWIEKLRPEHVSIYLLDLEDHSAWGRRAPDLPPEEDYAWFYREAADRLSEAGYAHYEISNWARPGSECRHNLKYWTGVPYRGFGVGAHSFSGGRRFWNTASIKEYGQRVHWGEPPIAGEERLTCEMRVEEAFLLGLRRMRGFNIWAAAEELGIRYSPDWFGRLRHLEKAGFVEFDGNVLKLAPSGWLLANRITEELLWPTLLSTCEATR